MTQEQLIVAAENRRATYRLASAIEGLMHVDWMTREQKIKRLREYLGDRRVLADDVWQAAKRPWATHSASSQPNSWTKDEAESDLFWDLASALEDPDSPGILTGVRSGLRKAGS